MTTARRWPWAALATVVVVGVLACCGLAVAFREELVCWLPTANCRDIRGVLHIYNNRPDEITIKVGSTSMRVGPRGSLALPEAGCGESAFVAVDARGQEVGRLEPDPLCQTRTWIFEPDGTVRVVPGHASPTP